MTLAVDSGVKSVLFTYGLDKVVSPVVSIRGYGVVGDGSHDDTNALIAALQDVPTGGVLVCTNETLRITRPITVNRGDITLLLNNATLQLETVAGAFGLTFAGTKGADIPVIADIVLGTMTFTVAVGDVGAFEIGDYVKILSDELYFELAGRAYQKGEIVKVLSIDPATGVVTVEGNGFHLGYTFAGQTITATKISFVSNIKVIGGCFKGTGTDNGQTGLRFQRCKDVQVEGATFSDLEVGAGFDCCHSIDFTRNLCKDIFHAVTGYGVELSGSTQYARVSGNTFEHCRHGFTTAGYDGVVMHVIVSDNKAMRATNAALNTHGGTRFVEFVNNIISDSWGGISVYSPCSVIKGNVISNILRCAIFSTEAGNVNIVVEGNLIDYSSRESYDSISVHGTATVHELIEFIRVLDNTIRDAHNGTGIVVTGDDAYLVDVSGNTLMHIGYDGIKVLGGLRVQVCHNQLYHSYRSATLTIFGISITPAAGGVWVTVIGNQVTQWGSGVFVDSVTNILVIGNVLVLGAGTAYGLTATGTLETGHNIPAYAP